LSEPGVDHLIQQGIEETIQEHSDHEGTTESGTNDGEPDDDDYEDLHVSTSTCILRTFMVTHSDVRKPSAER
jgi:hypothetical protein